MYALPLHRAGRKMTGHEPRQQAERSALVGRGRLKAYAAAGLSPEIAAQWAGIMQSRVDMALERYPELGG